MFGPKQRRQEITDEWEKDPLLLCNKRMGQKSNAKYLGDYLSERGLADSIHLTALKRKGVVTRACYEIRNILADCRAHITGGIVSGFDMWEIAVIPVLLYNAETWQDISRKTLDELEKMQLFFLRSTLAVWTGCPIPLLYSETGCLLMECRILQKKLMFLHHLFHLPDAALAKEVLLVQTENGLPGIYTECKNFLSRFEIYDLMQFSKAQFKRLVKCKILELNKEILLEKAKSKEYKKIDINDLETNDFKLKSYFRNLSISDARLKFKLVSKMTPTVEMNFMSDKRFSINLWKCEGCIPMSGIGTRDTQEHIIVCPGYQKYREGKDLSKDSDLVSYFKCVIQHRMMEA